LMRASRAEDERLYDAVDGEWVPAEPGSRAGSTRPSAPPAADPCEVVELRAELLVLRASHERLRERVQRLESQISSVGLNEVLSLSPTPAVVMSRAADAPRAPESFASTLMQGQAPPHSESPAPRSNAPAAAILQLPAVAALTACLRGLIGEGVVAREKRPVHFDPSQVGPCWLSRLIDEAGLEVGVIVADRRATATVGGILFGLLEPEIEEQRTTELPSQDVIVAMSEAANQFCETINAEAGGSHVRVKPIEELAPGVLDWTGAASNALELELSDGAGRLFLFAR